MTTFVAENDLERALMSAASDRAHEAAFYRCLLASDLFVVDVSGANRPTGQHTLQTGAELVIPNVEIEGQRCVTAFTSLKRLEAFLARGGRYVAMNSRNLFELVGPDPVCLNPGADYAKLLVPEEIAALLDGSWDKPRRITVQTATTMLIGRPSDPQAHVTKALSALFGSRKDVRAAHLAWWVDPESGLPAHAVVAMETTEGSWDQVMSAIGAALRPVTRQDELIDFVPLDRSGIADEIRKHTKPFFRRRSLWPFS